MNAFSGNDSCFFLSSCKAAENIVTFWTKLETFTEDADDILFALKFAAGEGCIQVSKCFFADNCDALCTTYLKPMSDAEISSQIQDWSTGGGLFLDYCNLLHSYAACYEVILQQYN